MNLTVSKKGNQKYSHALLYSDFFDVFSVFLNMLADMPIKYRNVILPGLQIQLESAFAFQRDVKIEITQGKTQRLDSAEWQALLQEFRCHLVGFQGTCELGAKLKAMADGRVAQFLQNAQIVLERHGA